MFDRKITDYLIKWKNKKQRKPLIIRGARQVGKTSSVLMFAKKHFDNLININLEKSEHLKFFKEGISLEEFEKIVKINFQQSIVPGKTLIFIDEIQNSPNLIKLLRFFYEEKPKIHVIATGSLLEVLNKKQGFAMPVGRVEYLYLYPFDFFEYLGAKNEKELLNFLKNVKSNEKIPLAIHKKAMDLFYEYAMIGGMPEIIKMFISNKNLEDLKTVYSSLFTGYSEDVYKYSSIANAKYLKYIIERAPFFAGSIINYTKFGELNFKSRELSQGFETLERAMIVYQVKATKSTEIPLIAQNKRAKKILFLDIGLVNYQMGIHKDYLTLKNFNDFYRGKMAEQIVGQNLLAQYIDAPPKIFYWAREKPGTAEIDFCLNKDGLIFGIEVKSGKTGRLKSLREFSKLVSNKRIIRIYDGEFKNEKIKIDNKVYNLISLPFYLTPRILENF